MDTINSQIASEEIDPNEILLAAHQHDVKKLKELLRGSTSVPANVQDTDNGYTPLHSAIAACEPEDGDAKIEAHEGKEAEHQQIAAEPNALEDAAIETVNLLLQSGAIWNDLDFKNETPGCIANRLGLKRVYQIMVDAGVRAELLLNRLDEYQPLTDEESGDDEKKEEDGVSENPQSQPDGEQTTKDPKVDADEVSGSPAKPNDSAAHGTASDNIEYLRGGLSFKDGVIADADKNAVMMEWERDLMSRSADALVPREGLRVLNIGHGMGIIDGYFQEKSPEKHHIIEAHPEVLAHMKKTGWYEKPGVIVHEGRWQDIVPKIIEEGQLFDAIYFDTFGEDYKALQTFFDEYVIGLLDNEGKWGFFNGLGADRQVCYDVYERVVGINLLECGFDVDWYTVEVPDLTKGGTWKGLKRPYWALDLYRLPVVTWIDI